MNSTVGALAHNADRIIECIAEAASHGADVVAFPELAVTGYPPEDLVLKPELIGDNQRELERIAASVGDITAVVGFVDGDGSDIYNAAAIIQCGEIVGRHRKFYLPNYSVFDEQRYFKAVTEWAVYTVRGVKMGVTICEDIWYPGGPGTFQAMAGADVIVNISASPFRCGVLRQRYRMIATRATDQLSYVCYLNAVGGQDKLVFEGASFICDPDGNTVEQGRAFEEDLLIADLDIGAVFGARLHDTRLHVHRAKGTPDEGIVRVAATLASHADAGATSGIPIAAWSRLSCGDVDRALELAQLGIKRAIEERSIVELLLPPDRPTRQSHTS